MHFERAAIDQPRAVALSLKRMRNIRAGATRCERRRCKEQAQSIVAGQAVCRTCGDMVKMDRKVERQKHEREQMRTKR
jgi:hypothetical protein